MFDVPLDVFVDAEPPDAVSQSLAHLDDTGVSFVRELKNLFTEVRRDDCLVSLKEDPIFDAQLVCKSVVNSEYRIASVGGNPAVDALLDDYAEFVVG